MAVIGVARPAPLFSVGVDSYARLSDDALDEAVSRGFAFVGAYLDVLAGAPDYRDAIFARKLGIWLLTYAPTKDPLSAFTGTNTGARDVGFAQRIGASPGADITLDFESPAPGSDGASHINAASSVITKAAFGAALYVGGPEPLGGAALGALAPHHYAKGGGQVPEPPCGWTIVQGDPLEGIVLAGMKCDADWAKADYRGRRMAMWWAS